MQNTEILDLTKKLVTKYVTLASCIDSETNFMLFEEGERPVTNEYKRGVIKELIENTNNKCFAAQFSNKLCGYVLGLGNSFEKKKHVVNIVIGVLSDYQSLGIGSLLLNHLINSYKEFKVFHLTVVESNTKAIAFYEKNGFKKSGAVLNSLKISNKLVNEVLMYRDSDNLFIANNQKADEVSSNL